MVLLFAAVVLSFVPALGYATVIYWIDRFEKEPRRLLAGVFVWGAVVATIGAIIWSLLAQQGILLLTGSESLAETLGTDLVAPVVEETLKGLAVLIVFLAFRREFDSVLDGIVYGGIVGLGFAATENVLYLLGAGNEGGLGGLIGLFVLRVVLGGWNHAFFTAFTGIGLAVARFSHTRGVRIIAPGAGLLIAMAAHATHNSISTLLEASPLLGLGTTILVDWVGWAGMLGVIVWALRRESAWMRTYLQDELTQGLITPQQYRTACSSWALVGARTQALFSGRQRSINRFYQVCAELAQKKHQRDTVGDEGGNNAIIAGLQQELVQLAPAMRS